MCFSTVSAFAEFKANVEEAKIALQWLNRHRSQFKGEIVLPTAIALTDDQLADLYQQHVNDDNGVDIRELTTFCFAEREDLINFDNGLRLEGLRANIVMLH